MFQEIGENNCMKIVNVIEIARVINIYTENDGERERYKHESFFLLTRIIYFFFHVVEKGECILTHELHCTYIYTITYNPQLNVIHKLITHRFLITSLSSWIRSRKKQTARYVYQKIQSSNCRRKVGEKMRKINTCNCVRCVVNFVARELKGEKTRGRGWETKTFEKYIGISVRMCAVLVNRRIFGWEDISRWKKYFMTERFRGSLSLVLYLGICRITPFLFVCKHSRTIKITDSKR